MKTKSSKKAHRAPTDAKLFARIKELRACRRAFAVAQKECDRLRKKLDNDPRCPKDTAPAFNLGCWRLWNKLSREIGHSDASDQANAANRRQGKALLLVMKTPATTLRGLLEKLRATMPVTDSMPGAYDAPEYDLAMFNETGHPLAEFVADDLAAMIRKAGSERVRS